MELVERDAALQVLGDCLRSVAGGTGHTVLVTGEARDAGWNGDITGCMESSAGGMGHHYVNFGELLDDGSVDPLRPEALVYAPDATGKLRLVAVEFIALEEDVPSTGPAPELFGQAFEFNPGMRLWALHAWIWKHNPDGMFADWNQTVHCD